MNYLTVTAVAALTALLLAGCTQNEEPEGVIPQGYQDAVNKAGNIEDMLHSKAQDLEQDP